ncbi:MAG: glutathione S-transferase N-terminal domain-containing protein [Myxococcota bacterium]|nr:glutathione S-transferase N-terminal domain-containing protein [Myxococcota bacterium]
MIQLYTFATPNGHKVSVALEELGLPYETHVVDITRNDQFTPEFLARNPNNKIPVIVDPEGPGGKPFTLFESGAILIYLAEKTGKLLPQDPADRYRAIQWLMFQMSGLGPGFGQLNHFTRYAKEKVPYAVDRFTKEAERLVAVLESALTASEYLAGEYSIADIATFTWVQSSSHYFPDLFGRSKHVLRWRDAISARPAVQRGLKVPDLSKR